VPVGQRQPWLSRNIANDNGPPKSKRESPWSAYLPELPESLTKYFKRDPDGNIEPPDAEAFTEALERSVRDLEEATGKSREELAAAAALVDLKDLKDDGEPTEAEETSQSSERPAFIEEYVGQTSNSERTEIIDRPEDGTFMEVLEESVREWEEKTGKSFEDLVAELNSMDPKDLADLMQREKTIQSSRRQAPVIRAPTIPAPTINFFEQDADGNQTEITDTALTNYIDKSIVKMEKKTGKSRDELAAEVGLLDIKENLGELGPGSGDNSELTAKEALQNIESQTRKLEAQRQEIEKIPDLKNISVKDRLRLRRMLLGRAADGRNIDLENHGSLLTCMQINLHYNSLCPRFHHQKVMKCPSERFNKVDPYRIPSPITTLWRMLTSISGTFQLHIMAILATCLALCVYTLVGGEQKILPPNLLLKSCGGIIYWHATACYLRHQRFLRVLGNLSGRLLTKPIRVVWRISKLLEMTCPKPGYRFNQHSVCCTSKLWLQKVTFNPLSKSGKKQSLL
jgi:hypothetical protein